MDWIESHTTLAHHPKTRRLARALGIPTAAALGHLHCLWHWAAKYAPDGDLTRYESEDIAIGAMWDRSEYDDDRDTEAEFFVSALLAVQWIDADEDSKKLHDWHDYAGRFLTAREERVDATRTGAYGNHKRWHADRGIVKPDCDFCRAESRGEVGGEGRGDIPPTRVPDSLTPPDRTPQDRTGQDPPDRPDTTTGDGDEDLEENPTARKIRNALGDKYLASDLDPAIEAVVSKLMAGEKLTSPVGYARSMADKNRTARESRERSRDPAFEWCEVCEATVPATEVTEHVAAHERAEVRA